MLDSLSEQDALIHGRLSNSYKVADWRTIKTYSMRSTKLRNLAMQANTQRVRLCLV